MSYSPPEPPSPKKKLFDSDEVTAVVVAFIGIGLVVLWGLSRTETREMATLRQLGKQPLVEPAASSEANREQPLQTASPEGPVTRFPFQIFPNQPDTPDKIPEFSHSAPLGLPADRQQEDKQPSKVNRLATAPLSIISEEGDPASQPSPNLGIQTEESELGSISPPKDTTGVGGQLPELPSQPVLEQPVLEQPIESPTLAESPDLPAIQPIKDPVEFSDVPDEYWAKVFIDALSSRDLLSGFPDRTFQPDKPVTRAELAAQIAKVFSLQARENSLEFTDLPNNHWAGSVIKETVAAGFMKGYPDERFAPEQAVSRVQVLVAIVSGLRLTSNSDPADLLGRYQDRDKIPGWALQKVAAATEKGLVVNYPNLERFQPDKPATRSEVAAILTRALVYQNRLEDSPSRYVVRP